MNRRSLALIFCFVLGAALIRPLQQGLDADIGAHHQGEEIVYLPSAAVLKRLTFGFEAVIADLYWLRTVQHYGQRVFRPDAKFDLLEPLLEIVTTLDPQYLIAYRFGAIFLALPHPQGAGSPEKAVALLDAGIEANPAEWRLIVDKGFVCLWDLHDYARAAEVFSQASRHPQAPAWTKELAAAVYAKAGRREIARRIWRDRFETGETEAIRQNALFQLACLQAEEQMEELRAMISEFRRRSGRLPVSWQEMIKAGLLARAPFDPSGRAYILDPATGDVRLSPDSPIILPRL